MCSDVVARPVALLFDRSIASMLGLGFSSGIPFLLVYATLSAWLWEAKVPLGTLGLMSELTLAYKFRFVWAPFLDQYDAPLFSRWLGRRRGWIIVPASGHSTVEAGITAHVPTAVLREAFRITPRLYLPIQNTKLETDQY